MERIIEAYKNEPTASQKNAVFDAMLGYFEGEMPAGFEHGGADMEFSSGHWDYGLTDEYSIRVQTPDGIPGDARFFSFARSQPSVVNALASAGYSEEDIEERSLSHAYVGYDYVELYLSVPRALEGGSFSVSSPSELAEVLEREFGVRYLRDGFRGWVFPDGALVSVPEGGNHKSLARWIADHVDFGGMRIPSTSGDGSPFVEDNIGGIRVNLVSEDYVRMNEKEPTREQYDALMGVFGLGKGISIHFPYGDAGEGHSTAVETDPSKGAEYYLRLIRRFYSSGEYPRDYESLSRKGLKEAKSLVGGVFATESPYEVKSVLNSAADEIKVLYDPRKRLYMYGKANDYIHNEMLEKAWEAGYYPELNRWELPEYVERSGSNCLVYLWFIPGGDDGGRSIGVDDYTEEWVYPNGILCARSHYSETPLLDQSFDLPRVLGRPEAVYAIKDWETMEPQSVDPKKAFGESRINERAKDLSNPIKAWRVGSSERGFYALDPEYYSHSATGYNLSDAKEYLLDLSKAKVLYPMSDWGLYANAWSDIRRSKGDSSEFFDELGIRYDETDEGEAYTDTEALASWGGKHGYDAVYFEGIPSDYGYGPDFDEVYVINASNAAKKAENRQKAKRESYLTEKTRQQLLDKSRNGAAYAPDNQAKGRNRYERRKYSKVAATIKDYNSIDMNAFFKGDYLEFGVPVHGETDDYMVTVTFERILPRLQQEVKSDKNRLSEKAVLRALLGAFNTGDVYVSCTCLHPDTRIKLLDGTNPTVAEMKERFDKGEKLYVYSADEKGDFKPGEVEKVWVAKTARDFVKVTLDNGQEILTTPDHPYMLRNGEYAEAKDLVPGTSLMPMYFNEANGYTLVKLNSSTKGWKSVYKMVAEYFKHDEIAESEKRALTDKVLSEMSYLVAIHHKDFNKRNNNPENLQVMTSKEHWDYHASLTWDKKPESMKKHIIETSHANAIKRNAHPTEAMIKSRQDFVAKGCARNYDEDRKQQQREIMLKVHADHPELYTHDAVSKRIREAREKNPDITKKISESHKRLWANYNEEEYKARCAINRESVHKGMAKRVESFKKTWANKPDAEKEAFRKRLSEAHKGIKVVHSEDCKRKMSESAKALSPEIKAKRRMALLRANIKRVLDYMLAHGIPLSDDGYSEALSEMRKQDKRYNNYPSSVERAFNDFDDAVRHFHLNHKVAKVERVTLEDTPVYDIQVKDWHNFALDAGILVHNCADFTYSGFNYLAVKQDYNSNPIFGKAMQPPTIRNPNDDKGAACKHILRVLSDVSWMMNVARVIYNYIKVSRELMQRNYAEIIFPKVYGMPYKGVVQTSLMDKDDKWGDALLQSDKRELDAVIAAAKQGRDVRGRFSHGNPYAFKKRDAQAGPTLSKGGREDADDSGQPGDMHA